ncbi:ferredoxin:glutaredoxin reductase [Candidatus Desantisbacteria bacterium]|nr:ferredoxin:glutaredoxin reductase [Candidatus Desantisbacteria bacterium]
MENKNILISHDDIDKSYEKLKKDAESYGYNLNPDVEFAKSLVKGLLINEKRYGYRVCPCRLAAADKEKDIDIICPCDYRDKDISEFGTCYCALYVSSEAVKNTELIHSIPERRPKEKDRIKKTDVKEYASNTLSFPVWRCKVCGYLCARDNPPGICPICKASKERFEKFM